MRDGLQQLEGKRRNRGRNILPPRNPVAGHEAGPSLSVVLDESDEDTTSSEPVEVEQAAAAKHAVPDKISTSVGDAERDASVTGAHSEADHSASAPRQAGGVAAGASSSRGGGRAAGKPGKVRGGDLPDLSIDWADPLMHIVKPNRVAVDVSVESRFKAAAAAAGVPSNTELVMAALHKHLADLPAMVLARRPEEQGASEGFFVRRAPVSRAEPGVPVHLRPKVGEWEALGRIEQWVTGVITSGHPGRRKATKSEIITAALAVEYPAAP